VAKKSKDFFVIASRKDLNPFGGRGAKKQDFLRVFTPLDFSQSNIRISPSIRSE
jgi:hypothetical protein